MLARLIDGSAYIYRAYHAMPAMSRPSDNAPVGAINGFCRTLLSFTTPIEIHRARPEARFTAVIFDATRANWRNEIYPDYKAHRPPTPDDLKPQLPLMRKATEAFGMCAIEAAGYEADDIIATYTRLFVESGTDVEIVTGDKDLTQLMGDFDTGASVRVFSPFEKDPVTKENAPRLLDVEDVIKKFGVGPSLVGDALALMGDTADGVPGVPGVGIKTAGQLLARFGSLEGVLEGAVDVTQPKLRSSLVEFADRARVARRLVALEDHVPLNLLLPPGDLEFPGPDWREVREFLEQMEFPSLVDRVRGIESWRQAA